MSKTCCIPVTLLNKGALVSDLHYGPFSCYWWQPSDNGKVFSIRGFLFGSVRNNP